MLRVNRVELILPPFLILKINQTMRPLAKHYDGIAFIESLPEDFVL
jgi:hypothetical protein